MTQRYMELYDRALHFLDTHRLLVIDQTLLFIGFLAILLTLLLSKKLNNRIFDFLASASVLAVSFIVQFDLLDGAVSRGSVLMIGFALAFVMTVTIFILGFIKLKVLDYILLFAAFLLIDRYATIQYSFGNAYYNLLIFFAILAISNSRLGKTRGSLFHIWFSFIITDILGFVFNIIYDRVVRQIGYSFDSNIDKLLFWGVSTAAIVSVCLLLVYLLKTTFKKYFHEINQMGQNYPHIEKYFVTNTIIIFVTFIVVHLVYTQRFGYSLNISYLITAFSMFALLFQLSFLTQLFRVAYLKDNLQSKIQENQTLALYSSNLEKNLHDMRDIKHDIKNIFFTMGNYVEQSDNEDLKAYYQSKIKPFANDEIYKNDLYSRLTAIDNEQLKAFLYYKITQAVERKVIVSLEISQSYSTINEKMDFIDLIRVLGILLDNAIEECMTLVDAKIHIKISKNENLISYIIKNTVDPTKKETGIKKGVSTKGSERGSGLIIVQNIVEKYDFLTLNSYFQDEFFVQCLNEHGE